MALIEDNKIPCCIRAYGDGCLLLRDERRIQESVIINKNQIVSEWGPRSIEELKPTHFEPIIAQKPEIVLLGTGPEFRFPDHEILAALYAMRIGVECMDTAAACRSYVALFAESRDVLAALII